MMWPFFGEKYEEFYEEVEEEVEELVEEKLEQDEEVWGVTQHHTTMHHFIST